MKKKLVVVFAMISVSLLSDPIYRLPPITYPTKEEQFADFLNDGKWLMALKGIPDGDETLVCTNWTCPTSIVVNAEQYSVMTNMGRWGMRFKVMTTNVPPLKVADGNIQIATNAATARLVTFANCANTSLYLPDYALGVSVQSLDVATNVMAITRYSHPSDESDLICKNIMLKMYAQTNAVDFAVAILNAGLPENERIVIPPQP